MTQLIPAYGLLFTDVRIHARGSVLVVEHVLVDTGSSGTLLRTDDLATIGVILEGADRYVNLVGIGGTEAVIQKRIDKIEVGELSLSPFTIQLGRVEYGFGINAILGLDFMRQAGAVIDLKTLELRQD